MDRSLMKRGHYQQKFCTVFRDVRLYKAGRKFFPETFCSVKQCGCESRISGLCRHRWTPAADSVANMAHSGNDSGETIICQRKPEGQVV